MRVGGGSPAPVPPRASRSASPPSRRPRRYRLRNERAAAVALSFLGGGFARSGFSPASSVSPPRVAPVGAPVVAAPLVAGLPGSRALPRPCAPAGGGAPVRPGPAPCALLGRVRFFGFGCARSLWRGAARWGWCAVLASGVSSSPGLRVRGWRLPSPRFLGHYSCGGGCAAVVARGRWFAVHPLPAPPLGRRPPCVPLLAGVAGCGCPALGAPAMGFHRRPFGRRGCAAVLASRSRWSRGLRMPLGFSPSCCGCGARSAIHPTWPRLLGAVPAPQPRRHSSGRAVGGRAWWVPRQRRHRPFLSAGAWCWPSARAAGFPMVRLPMVFLASLPPSARWRLSSCGGSCRPRPPLSGAGCRVPPSPVPPLGRCFS